MKQVLKVNTRKLSLQAEAQPSREDYCLHEWTVFFTYLLFTQSLLVKRLFNHSSELAELCLHVHHPRFRFFGVCGSCCVRVTTVVVRWWRRKSFGEINNICPSCMNKAFTKASSLGFDLYTKRQTELCSEVWKLFSQNSTDISSLLPCAVLPRQARGTQIRQLKNLQYSTFCLLETTYHE